MTLTNETNIKQVGLNSLKLVFSSAPQYAGIRHLYGTPQNWSANDIIEFYFYGANSGNTIYLYLTNATSDDMYTGANPVAAYTIVDNWSGPKHFVLPKSAFTIANGFDWTGTRKVMFRWSDPAPANATNYIDRLIFDVCPSIPVKDLSIAGLYISNELEESGTGISLLDDSLTGWNTSGAGTGSYAATISQVTTPIMKGVNTVKLNVGSGSSQTISLWKYFASPLNLSTNDFVTVWFYGSNSGDQLDITFDSDNQNDPWYLFSNTAMLIIIDNFTGPKRFVLPRTNPTSSSGGTLDWTHIYRIRISSTPSKQGAWLLSRLMVDVGKWAFIEFAVPDVLSYIRTIRHCTVQNTTFHT